jgi:uncharacterized membrane protein
MNSKNLFKEYENIFNFVENEYGNVPGETVVKITETTETIDRNGKRTKTTKTTEPVKIIRKNVPHKTSYSQKKVYRSPGFIQENSNVPRMVQICNYNNEVKKDMMLRPWAYQQNTNKNTSKFNKNKPNNNNNVNRKKSPPKNEPNFFVSNMK